MDPTAPRGAGGGRPGGAGRPTTRISECAMGPPATPPAPAPATPEVSDARAGTGDAMDRPTGAGAGATAGTEAREPRRVGASRLGDAEAGSHAPALPAAAAAAFAARRSSASRTRRRRVSSVPSRRDRRFRRRHDRGGKRVRECDPLMPGNGRGPSPRGDSRANSEPGLVGPAPRPARSVADTESRRRRSPRPSRDGLDGGFGWSSSDSGGGFVAPGDVRGSFTPRAR